MRHLSHIFFVEAETFIRFLPRLAGTSQAATAAEPWSRRESTVYTDDRASPGVDISDVGWSF
jgi:hypothetical protein